jgi:predicted nucleic acid-binding protein
MPNVIISDTSCLIILSKINKLFILEKLFGNLIITPEVEIEFGGELPNWIRVQKAKDQTSQTLINSSLDLGEASSIALAIEFENPLLILDDLKARNFAESLRLSYTGTFGVLLDAKKRKIIDNVKDSLTQIEKTDFSLSKKLTDYVLALASEK